jgi:hypothetical protein
MLRRGRVLLAQDAAPDRVADLVLGQQSRGRQSDPEVGRHLDRLVESGGGGFDHAHDASPLRASDLEAFTSNAEGASVDGSDRIAASSSTDRIASSIAWAAAASATVWKMPIGQPMHSIRWRIMTRIVAGHLRMISSTDISGSMAEGCISGGLLKLEA